MFDLRLRQPSDLSFELTAFSAPARRLVGLLFLAFFLLVAAGCGRGEASENVDGEGETPAEETADAVDELPPVEAVALQRGRIEAVLRFSTNLEAENDVQVFSQASRQITRLLVEEGDRVRKGDLLVRLQDEEQRSALAMSESQLRKAQREYERQKNLFAKELISEQDFNNATYEVEQLQLAVEDAQRNLSYTEVRAPISGTITERAVNLGDQITINQHLFDIVDFDSIVARVYVPERELARLALDQEARLFADSLGGVERLGEVRRIAPVVDPKSGTVKVTVGIPGNQGLLPGMYVEVELVTNIHTDALLVPKRSVIYDNNQAFVYRVKDDETVEQVFFDVVLEDRDFVEPQGDRLAAGDRIVTAGQAGLKNGAKVRLATGVVRRGAASVAATTPETAGAAAPETTDAGDEGSADSEATGEDP